MEIVGKISEFTPVESGTSTRGEWKKRQVVIKTLDQNPVDIAFTAMGKHLDEVEPFVIGDIVRVRFGVSSRKYEDKWFSDVALWGMQKA